MDHYPILKQLQLASFDGELVHKEGPGYDALRKVWNGVFDKRPAAIVRVRSVEDVVRTIDIAARNQATLAVRCGGHSLPGLSTCNDGIVLDMSRIESYQSGSNFKTC